MIHFPKSENIHTCLDSEKAKTSGTYNCGCVLEHLKSDFKNKCYICEDKEPHSINIEHFKPHKGDLDLKFNWDNLFYCCAHCNNNKLARSEYDDILNCTLENDQVDKKIKYEIDPYPGKLAIITALEINTKVENTVKLLTEVYNGTTVLKKLESANLRNKLLKEIRKFQDLLFEFVDDSFNEEEKKEIKNKIIRELRPTSNFTAFKLWIIRQNDLLRPDFNDYI